MSAIFVGLISTSFGLKAQSLQFTDAAPKASSFQMGTYIDQQQRLTLLLGPGESKRLGIKLKDAQQSVIYQCFIKGKSAKYSQKFNFEDAQPGVYELEVSDGLQTVVRRVEVVDVPAIGSQRFLTYSK